MRILSEGSQCPIGNYKCIRLEFIYSFLMQILEDIVQKVYSKKKEKRGKYRMQRGLYGVCMPMGWARR